MKPQLLPPCLFILYCLFFSLPAHAEAPHDLGGGALLLADERGAASEAPLIETRVEIDVTGLIARARVIQTFRNPSPNWTEGRYVFPLPADAAVDHLDMQVGERRIEGQIQERQQARQTYEQARQEGKVASLVEQERPNIFSQSVANIAPDAEVTVAIEYQQTVSFRDGQFSLRFPLVVGPRYIPGVPLTESASISAGGWGKATGQVPDAGRITPPVLRPGEGNGPRVSLHIRLAAGLPLATVSSPSHGIVTRTGGDQSIDVQLSATTVPADRDFVLQWAPTPADAPRAALFAEQIQGQTHALMMVMPPNDETAGVQPPAREVVFVVDTSGSMAGESMPQAKAALQLALQRLRPADRFNIIRFSDTTRSLYQASQTASPGNLSRASGFVSALLADGGTEMAPALRLALQDDRQGKELRQVVFLTDGAVGNEDALFDLIRTHLGRSRLFTVGIGSAPNSWFMTRAADFGRGSYTYIADQGQVQARMDDLFRRLERPAMTDLALNLPEGLSAEIHPERIPDLYDGEPLMVVMRFPLALESISGELSIQGQRGGRPWQVTLPLDRSGEGEGIGVLWARRRIADLMARERSTEAGGVREQIVDTALAYHLVSQYTSLVAVDVTPSRPLAETLASHAVPTHLPKGWEFDKVFGSLPRTATAAPLFLAMGAGLLFLGAVFAFETRQVR